MKAYRRVKNKKWRRRRNKSFVLKLPRLTRIYPTLISREIFSVQPVKVDMK